MALQNAEKRHFHSEQNGSCIQQLIEMHGIFAHDFVIKVPATEVKGTPIRKEIAERRASSLELLPADFSDRNFDVHLSERKNSTERLLKMSRALRQIYVVLFLDCAPRTRSSCPC